MAESRRRFPGKWLWYAAAAVTVLAALVSWQMELEKDPPMYLSGIGQSLSTDPVQYTFHSRNKHLYGEWDPYDYGRWTVYQHSLTSLVGYWWFGMAGVSLVESNRVGIFLAIGALIFLLLGLSRHHSPWVLAAVAAAYAINVTLLTHGRLSYLENGLVFWAAVAFWIYSWWGERLWGLVLAAAAIAAGVMTGKLFGAVLIGALVVADFSAGPKQKYFRAGAATGAFVGAAVLLSLMLYGSDLSAAFAYGGEQAFGLRGFPDGLKSPWAFFEHLISYGFSQRLYFLNPELLLFLIVAALLVVRYRLNEGSLTPPLRLAVFWTLFAWVGLSPLNYSPIRYALLLIPAVMVLCFAMFDRTSRSRIRPLEDTGRWAFGLIVLALWLGLFHVVGNVFYFNTFPRPVREITWVTSVAAAVIGYFVWKLLRKNAPDNARRGWLVTLGAVVVVMVAINVMRVGKFHFSEQIYTIQEANDDIDAILGEECVVSGPYGPVLTFDTEKRSFIHLFQVAEVDPDLFDENPITHLAMDVSNFTEAVKNYPVLAGIQPLTTYYIRDQEVSLYRVAELFDNSRAGAYELSDFERARAAIQAKQFDTAAALVGPLYREHPESKSVTLLWSETLLQTGQVRRAYTVMLTAARQFPTDWNIQLQTGRFLLLLAMQQQDRAMFNRAQTYFQRAVEINPYRSVYARRIFDQVQAQFGRPQGP